MLNPPRTEVGFAAAVTLDGVHRIAKRWRPLLAAERFSLAMHGVFCHAAPLVEFRHPRTAQPNRCELADFLIVIDVVATGGTTRRAALIQAKMANVAGGVKLTGNRASLG